MFLPLTDPNGVPLPTTAQGARERAPMGPGFAYPEPFQNMTDIPRTPLSPSLSPAVMPKAQDQLAAEEPPAALPPPAMPTPKTDMLPMRTAQAGQGVPLDGEVMPPEAGGAAKKKGFDARTMLRQMAGALIVSTSPAERIQGMQMLFESTQPTPGEVAAAERDRLSGVVDTAGVSDEARENARIMAALGGKPEQIAEALGIDAKGMENKRREKEAANAGKLKAQGLVDEVYAKEYVPFKLTGSRDIENNLSALTEARRVLSTPGLTPTGPLMGLLSDTMLSQFPSGKAQITARELIETVGQRNLKEILGAQFAQKEGEAFLARVFNPKLAPEQNMRRAARLMTQIERAYQDKLDAAAHFEQNGTLKGFEGKLAYSLRDFEDAVEGKVRQDVDRRTPGKQNSLKRPDMTPDEILAKANEAIANGKDPRLVAERLRQWGLEPR